MTIMAAMQATHSNAVLHKEMHGALRFASHSALQIATTMTVII
jgi:hypothetical protein